LTHLYHEIWYSEIPPKFSKKLDKEFLDTAQLIINSRADLNAWSNVPSFPRNQHSKFRERSALHQAAMYFQEPYCRLLITNKYDINRPSWNDGFGRNCLHWACLAPYEVGMDSDVVVPCVSPRSVEYLKFLIFNGIDVDLQDFEGKTALCLAAHFGWLAGVQTLIETPMPRKRKERSSKVLAFMLYGSK
jgi:ankyrin repeat protein